MRNSSSGLTAKTSSKALTRALLLSAVALGIGLLVTSGVARAQDDDDGDDKTFEEKIIDSIMRGMGAVSMENSGIDYRERSPLVVPPKLDLPPPVNAKSEVNVPNWPKDPDEARRKAARAARKKSKPSPEEAARLLTPSELNGVKTGPSGGTQVSDSTKPGNGVTMFSPSQLGFDGRISNFFRGNSTETAPFKGEPPRQELTEPPPGYQTPSPNYAYGTGKALAPIGTHTDIMSGKEVPN